MNNKTKVILTTLTLFFSGYISAAYGVTVKNESGLTLSEVYITPSNYKPVRLKNGDSIFIKSEKGGRYVYWTVKETQREYLTNKEYAHPDKIVIKNYGEKYQMTTKTGLKSTIEPEQNSLCMDPPIIKKIKDVATKNSETVVNRIKDLEDKKDAQAKMIKNAGLKELFENPKITEQIKKDLGYKYIILRTEHKIFDTINEELKKLEKEKIKK